MIFPTSRLLNPYAFIEKPIWKTHSAYFSYEKLFTLEIYFHAYIIKIKGFMSFS